MCGIAGTISPGPVDELMREAARRGPHSWGAAGGGELVQGAGRYAGQPLPAGRPLLGHCRLATDGRLARVQPIQLGGVVLTHNGVVPDVDTADELDSTAILRHAAVCSATLPEAVRSAVRALGLRRYALAVSTGERVVLGAAGLPLWVSETAWCSRQFFGAVRLEGWRIMGG